MNMWIWALIWILGGTLNAFIILPYSMKITNKINSQNEKMDATFFIGCYIMGPIASIVIPIILLIILEASSSYRCSIITKINNFWKLP